MKRAIFITSILAVSASLWMTSSILNKKHNSSATPPVSVVAFAGFPVDQPKSIEFDHDNESIRQLTPREYSDQLKDWLLMTIVSDAGLSPTELNQTLFDLPPIRYGYVRPVGSFEYGETRSRSIGKGRLVALIPKAEPASQLDALTAVADDARKNTGDIPKSILVFEYEIAPGNGTAVVTRRADVDGNTLFTAEKGYVETNVAGAEDLRQFMSSIDDLTFARAETASLRLGGRKRYSHHHHNITIEDAAALWSAQMKLRVKNDKFDAFVAQKQQAFEEEWRGRTYKYDFERIRLESERDAELTQIRQEIAQERDRLGVVQGIGFSLDPSFELKRVSDALEGRFGEAIVADSAGKISPAEVEQAAQDARRAASDPKHEMPDSFYAMMQKLNPSVARELIIMLKGACSYQAARYDGALKGTEVGMVLFYTDLLAKLWALDFMSSAPDKQIPEFNSMSHLTVSAIYKKEMDVLPSTRLWFGVQSRGFSLKDDGAPTIMLAPVATRLYAASSDSLTPGKETAPNPASADFLGWWDDHYAEVAAFEPEYERLNEIMKWSIVISWLDQKGRLDFLSGLQKIAFKKDNWFPDWVKQHTDLRFQSWDGIQFMPRGFAATEALPLLHSDRGVANPLMGGVSLAEKEVIASRGAISEEVSELGRRPTLDWKETTQDMFKTVDGSEFKFAQVGERYTLDATLKEGTPFRAVDAEFADFHYNREIAFEDSSVRMEMKNAGVPIGDLKINRAPNSFRISWESRETDTATSLARRMSTSADPAATLRADSRVLASIKTEDGNFLVRLKGSSNWLKLGLERPTENGAIESGWQSRVAPLEPRAKSINLAWFDNEKVASAMGGDDRVLRVSSHVNSSDGAPLQLEARPPPNLTDKTVRIQGVDFKIQQDTATGDAYVRWSDLPDQVREHPESLRALTGGGKPPEGPPPFDNLAARDFDGAARDLIDNPLGYKLALDEHYSQGLHTADKLIANGDNAEAIKVLDNLESVHGNTTEIAVRKAIILTEQAKASSAADVLNSSTNFPFRDRDTLFNEILARVQSTAAGTEHDNLVQVAQFVGWKDMMSSQSLHDGVPVLSVDNGKLSLEFHVSQKLKGNSISNLTDASNPAVYVQDTPALSNLDSPQAIQQALHAGVQGRLPVVIQLPERELALFRPAKIYAQDQHTTFHKVSSDSAAATKTNWRPPTNYRPCVPNDNRSDCADQSQPVYVVMDPNQANSKSL